MYTWFITGANSGLGLAITKLALKKGDKVIAAVRNVSKIPSSISAAIPIQLDMSSPPHEIINTAQTALERHGHVDVLVNCAGWCLTGYFEELAYEKISDQFQVNVHGPMSLVKAFIPAFRNHGAGQILNISSPAGFTAKPGTSAYNASKAAFDAYTESVAAEVQQFNIKVRLIEPGFFFTEFLSTSTPQPDEPTGAYKTPIRLEGYLEARIKQQKIGDPEKFAERIWDLVYETGLAVGLDSKVVRIPVGADTAGVYRDKLKQLSESLDATEKIWNSTDMSPEQIEEVKTKVQA